MSSFVLLSPNNALAILMQEILGKVYNLGLADFVKNHIEANLYIRKVIALAFLPENVISRSFEQLMNSLWRDTRRRLEPFNVYFQNFWLQRIGGGGFSVFSIANRTNNIIESYHSRLLHRMAVHPTAWDFMSKFPQRFIV